MLQALHLAIDCTEQLHVELAGADCVKWVGQRLIALEADDRIADCRDIGAELPLGRLEPQRAGRTMCRVDRVQALADHHHLVIAFAGPQGGLDFGEIRLLRR